MTYFLGLSTHEMTPDMWTVLRTVRGEGAMYFQNQWAGRAGRFKMTDDYYLSLAAIHLAEAGLVKFEDLRGPVAYATERGRRFYDELAPEYDREYVGAAA